MTEMKQVVIAWVSCACGRLLHEECVVDVTILIVKERSVYA